MFDGRVEWLEDDYEVDLPLDKDKAEVLLTVSSIEMMKYPKSIVAMARLMNQARVDWTFSTDGYESTNFGFLSGKSTYRQARDRENLVRLPRKSAPRPW